MTETPQAPTEHGAQPPLPRTPPGSPRHAVPGPPGTALGTSEVPRPSRGASSPAEPERGGAEHLAAGSEPAPGSLPPRPADADHEAAAGRRRLHPAVVWALVVLLIAATASTAYLFRTSNAWEDRAEAYLAASRDLGDELAGTRSELTGAQSELEAVRTQLATAQARIVELADEKAQLGDDREAQRQLVDYQARVADAAGRVALALDQCVQGQQQLIGYLQRADQYDPAQLEQYGTDVAALCQAATEANIALQDELGQ